MRGHVAELVAFLPYSSGRGVSSSFYFAYLGRPSVLGGLEVGLVVDGTKIRLLLCLRVDYIRFYPQYEAVVCFSFFFSVPAEDRAESQHSFNSIL